MAAERTYLALQRTALALVAAGVAVAAALPDAGAVALRRAIGLVLVLSGAVTAELGRRWLRAAHTALRREEPLPRIAANRLLSWVLVVVGLAGAALVLMV